MSPTAGAASSQPPRSLGKPAASLPSARNAGSTSRLDPAMTSALPSPSTSAIAGQVTIVQPSITRGYGASHEPPAASQPPMRCSNGIAFEGFSCAATSVESTIPANRSSGPPFAVRPNAALAPSASTDGALAGDDAPRPLLVYSKRRAPSPP